MPMTLAQYFSRNGNFRKDVTAMVSVEVEPNGVVDVLLECGAAVVVEPFPYRTYAFSYVSC